MKLYRRTLTGYLETHTLETAFDHLTNRSIIHYETLEEREFLEGMRLMHGLDYVIKQSCNFTSFDQWEWFTYNPRKHF